MHATFDVLDRDVRGARASLTLGWLVWDLEMEDGEKVVMVGRVKEAAAREAVGTVVEAMAVVDLDLAGGVLVERELEVKMVLELGTGDEGREAVGLG